MESTLTAHGFLLAAHHLIRQAVASAPEQIGTDLQDALNSLAAEISHLADYSRHQQNLQIAERLGPGFGYCPDDAT